MTKNSLDAKFKNFIDTLPTNDGEYHRIDVTLKSGERMERVKVLNGTIIEPEIRNEDIQTIKYSDAK